MGDESLMKVKELRKEKIEFALKEPVKLEEHEKKNSLENKTNVETRFLETPQLMLDENFTKFKQPAQEIKETLHQGELEIANNKEACQLRDNKKEKIVTNKSMSEEQKNENILRKNEEEYCLKTAAYEMLSKIENNKKMLKES